MSHTRDPNGGRCRHWIANCEVEVINRDGKAERVPGVRCAIAPHPISRILCAYCHHYEAKKASEDPA